MLSLEHGMATGSRVLKAAVVPYTQPAKDGESQNSSMEEEGGMKTDRSWEATGSWWLLGEGEPLLLEGVLIPRKTMTWILLSNYASFILSDRAISLKWGLRKQYWTQETMGFIQIKIAASSRVGGVPEKFWYDRNLAEHFKIIGQMFSYQCGG